jgi:hypothetical protein
VDGTPHDVPTPNRSISDLYKACRKSAEKYRRSRINREACLFQTLGRALELCRLSEATPEAEAELTRLMNEKGIRKTKRTKNHFTPIVKLIFEGEVIEEEKSLVMRCASILRLADSRNIEPDGIATFIDGQGGMVQCYKNDPAAHPSATATSTKPDPIEALRENARKCDPTALRQLVPDGPATALLEVDQIGNILLLGARTATSSEIRRYKASTKQAATDNAATDTPDIAIPAAVEHAGNAPSLRGAVDRNQGFRRKMLDLTGATPGSGQS